MRNRQDLIYLGVIILTLLLASGLTWMNYQFASQSNVEDAFAPLWAGARLVVTRQANPYDLDAISRTLRSTDVDASRFVYPYYGIMLFLPFGLISSYPLAKAIWMTVIMASLVALIFASQAATNWRPSGRILLAFVLSALGGYSAIRGAYTGNPGVLVAMIVAFGILAVTKGRSRAAGILFGLSLIKPTMVALLLPYVFIYAVSKRDLRLIRSMVMTIAVLLAAAFATFPAWFYHNFAEVVLLYMESYPASISAVIASLFGDNRVMVLFAAIFGLWLVVEWWRSLGKDVRWFLWTSALTLTLNEFIGIPTNTSNYVMLIFPLVLAFATIDRRWKNAGSGLVLFFMVLTLLLTWLPYYLLTGFDASQPEPHYLLFALPLAALGLLYWVRYWALSSIKLKVDRFEALKQL